jgi:hypothetical protein
MPRVAHVLTAFILLAHIFLWLLCYPAIEEDAFIYLRAAKNIADGYGYVFNIGGEHIEVGTSPVWVFLLVMCQWLHVPQIFAVKTLGLIFSLLTILVTGRLSFILTRSASASLLAMTVLSTSYPFVFWVGQGLETPLVAFLLTLNALALLDKKWRGALLSTAIALVLARPEGIMYLIPMAGWGLWEGYCRDYVARRKVITAVVAALLSVVVCTVLRIWYFSDICVHSFYFKSSAIGSAQFSFQDALKNPQYQQSIFLLVFIAIGLFLKKQSSTIWLLLGFFVLQVIWYIKVVDHFPYERHLVAALPLLYIMFAVVSSSLLYDFSSKSQRLFYSLLLVLALFPAFIGEANPTKSVTQIFLQEPINITVALLHDMQSSGIATDNPIELFFLGQNLSSLRHNWDAGPGKFLDAAYPKGIKVAFHEMGQTPYYAGSDKRFIDLVGLTTKSIGFYKFSLSFDERPATRELWELRCDILERFGRDKCQLLELNSIMHSILNEKPDVIMVHAVIAAIWGDKLPPFKLLQNERFRREYREKYILDRYVHVYERVDRRFPVYEGNVPGVEITSSL